MAVRLEFLSSVGFHPDGGHHYTIDSKSMRKVGPFDDIVTMFSPAVAAGGQMIVQGRVLIKLH